MDAVVIVVSKYHPLYLRAGCFENEHSALFFLIFVVIFSFSVLLLHLPVHDFQYYYQYPDWIILSFAFDFSFWFLFQIPFCTFLSFIGNENGNDSLFQFCCPLPPIRTSHLPVHSKYSLKREKSFYHTYFYNHHHQLFCCDTIFSNFSNLSCNNLCCISISILSFLC